MSTGLAGPVSAPAHSLPAGSPPTLGSHGALGSVGPSHVEVSALRYPSGQADQLDIGGQVSTGIVVAEIHAESEQLSSSTTSRQPSATAAAARLPPEGPSLAPNYGDGPARRAQSLSARSSSSFRSLSPPVLSPAYVIDQPEPGLPRSVRVASPQRVLSPHARLQRALSMSPMYQPSLVEIWVDEDPAPPPRPAAASVDRARPVAASVEVGHTSLPYASVDTRRPGFAAVGPRLLEPATSVFAGASSVAAHPGSLDVASSRIRVRSGTPMPSSDVGQRMRVDVSRPLDLTLPTAGDDVQLYAPWSTASDDVPPGNVDVAGSAYDPARLLYLTLCVSLAHRRLLRLGLLLLVFIGLCLL